MAKYNNPVQRGFFPDPSVIRVGEDYYMVNSSFEYFPAIPISHSKDMIHWHVIGHAITNPDYLDLTECRNSHGIWAPDIEYADGKFIIMATYRLNGDGARGNNVLRRQLMVTSDKPEGPYSEPAWLEVDDIDPSLFIDPKDGQKYMVIAAGARLVPISDDCTKVLGEPRVAWAGTGERCPEGPHMMYKDGYYYAILAEGGTGYGHGINVARSKELFGEYEPSPYNPVLRQFDPDALLQRCGHGKLVQDQNGKWWCYYLAGRPNKGHYSTIGRESALDPVEWTEDGWFIINNRKGPSLEQEGPDIPEVKWERNLFDDFDSDKLNLEWEFVRRPDAGSYSLTQRPGFFRIWTRDGRLDEIRSKNTLLRREQELCYLAETKLFFNPTKDGEQAGLTCYYSTVTYARASVCYENGKKIQVVINRNHGEELMAEISLQENVCTLKNSDAQECAPIWLRVCVEYLNRTFYYSLDGENWIKIVTLENCIYLCDEGVPDDPKRHTGTLVGIYANNGGCGSRIPADFDYFSYKD